MRLNSITRLIILLHWRLLWHHVPPQVKTIIHQILLSLLLTSTTSLLLTTCTSQLLARVLLPVESSHMPLRVHTMSG